MALRHGNAVTLGEELQRLGEGEVLDLLNELEDIAGSIAAEAFVILQDAMNAERWCLLGMKRTKAHVALAGPLALQADVLANHVHDVELILQLVGETHSVLDGRCS
jgi:hypothetical protein